AIGEARSFIGDHQGSIRLYSLAVAEDEGDLPIRLYTLFADYHFLSEGVQSNREIAFILSDSKAVEAYGALVVTNEGTRFSDRSALSVEHSFSLSKENCKEE
ncbi:MAG TPA: hypothetical protein VL092_04535, partial [Chitinophagaceae bacterium]|nr:hypothetical protein [Chitinophagaceae bacterium]